MGQVPQDMVLFNDTIYYNILYGRLDATEDEVYNVSLIFSSSREASPLFGTETAPEGLLMILENFPQYLCDLALHHLRQRPRRNCIGGQTSGDPRTDFGDARRL